MSKTEFKQTLDKNGRPTIKGGKQMAKMNGCWDTLKQGITNIFSLNTRDTSFELLYNNTYLMICHQFGGMLYNNLIETVTDHLRTSIRPILETATNDNFINEFTKCYDAYTVALVRICEVVQYMSERYVRIHKLESVKEFGLRLFREEIVNHAPIKEKLKATMTHLRQKEPLDGATFQCIFEMLAALGVEEEFKAALIVYVE